MDRGKGRIGNALVQFSSSGLAGFNVVAFAVAWNGYPEGNGYAVT
jgi:hypothetical protein